MMISVVIPAYNEEERIANSLKVIAGVLERYCPRFEVIVVDDGSADRTYEEALSAKPEGSIRVERYTPNQGKGFALKYGTRFAKGDVIVFLDADLDLHPNHIVSFLKLMQRTGADIVIGSKRHKDSRLYYPVFRNILSLIYSTMLLFLFGLSVSDTQTGLKAFKRKPLIQILKKVSVKKYAFDLEVLVNAHKLKYSIVEAPITLKFNREISRIRLNAIFYIFLDTLAIFYRLHIRKYYDSR